MPRYAPNPYDAASAPSAEWSAEEAWRRAGALLPELTAAAQRGAIPTSRGSNAGFEVYTGLGGLALAFYRASCHCRERPPTGPAFD